jgi:tRNA 2-thiocytidine biosynthesis protein TtcA
MSDLEKIISKKIGKAIFDYKMIKENDKILIGVSGGKDSLTLLYDLIKRQKSFPIKYKIQAAHIITDFTICNKEKIEKLFNEWGIEYHFIKVPVLKRLKPDKKMNCYWCSNQRRIELAKIALKIGCNKIALGHHLDDIVETILMNMFLNGKIAAMNPIMKYKKFNYTIIRPLAYIKEELIKKFATKYNFLNLVCNCPYGNNSKRLEIKQLIKQLNKNNKLIRENIFTSLKNICKDYLI